MEAEFRQIAEDYDSVQIARALVQVRRDNKRPFPSNVLTALGVVPHPAAAAGSEPVDWESYR